MNNAYRGNISSLCNKVFNPQMAENHLHSHIEYVSTSGGTWLMCPKEVDFMGNFIGANIPFLCVPVCTNDHFSETCLLSLMSFLP